MPSDLFLYTLLKIIILLFVLLTAVAYIVWFERKVVARIQSSRGPTRAGLYGLLQPLADAIKLLTKEDITPSSASRWMFTAAPALSAISALLVFAVIPFGPPVQAGGIELFQVADLDIGLLFMLAVGSMGVYGIALAGWSSNSKYSLLGGLRGMAQTISYELAIGLALVGVLLMSGSLSLRSIVDSQSVIRWGFVPQWNVFPQFVGFLCYIAAATAGTNRLPFGAPGAETELVAGYHTEYSSMCFAMFFLAQYANMLAASCVATLLFLGGWHGPLFGPDWLQTALPLLWFALKVLCLLFIFMWICATLPRFRYDQLLAFGWKVLVPVSFGNVVATSLWLAIQYS